MLSLFFSFQGRLARSRYWLVLLFWQFVKIGLPMLWYSWSSMPGDSVDIQDTTYEDPAIYEATTLYFVLTLISLISVVSATFRRLHDINASGLWALLSFVPVIDFVMMIVLGCIDSQPGTNRYGINPKGVASYYIAGANEEMRMKELMDLANLHEKGYLTKEEFERQKSNLLRDL